MKTKQKKIVHAYKKLEELIGQRMPLDISHKLWKLMKMLEPYVVAQQEKEIGVITKHKPEISPDGTMTFESDEKKAAFAKDMAETIHEASQAEVDLGDYEKVVLKADDRLELSVEDIEALSDFIDFEE